LAYHFADCGRDFLVGVNDLLLQRLGSTAVLFSSELMGCTLFLAERDTAFPFMFDSRGTESACSSHIRDTGAWGGASFAGKNVAPTVVTAYGSYYGGSRKRRLDSHTNTRLPLTLRWRLAFLILFSP